MIPSIDQMDGGVLALCPDVLKKLIPVSNTQRTERELWREMTCCLLSSQVSYEMALKATERLEETGYFESVQSRMADHELLSIVLKTLLSPMKIEGRLVRYRFPNLRAKQIVETRRSLKLLPTTLGALIYSGHTAYSKRGILMDSVKGFGPKQASMFLRNVGATQQLAILDRHTIMFMEWRGLLQEGTTGTLTARKYEKYEHVFQTYAKKLGYSTGCVDWAVWIFVKAVKALQR